MQLLLQSTVYNFQFKMIDSSDHFSKKTGLSCTVNISKNGAAFGGAAGAVTEIGNGWYQVALTTTDTNTLGDLTFYITAANADDTDIKAQVVAVNVMSATAFITGVNSLAPPTNWNLMAIDASGRGDLGKWLGVAPNALSAGRVDAVPVTRSSTATAGTSTTLTLDGSASAIDNFYKGAAIIWTSGANLGVVRVITGYVGATKVATFAVALPTTADATPTFTVTAIRHNLPGTDGKVLISTDAQDLSGSLDVNAKKVGGGTVASGSIPNAVAGAAGGLFIAGSNADTAANIAGNITGNLSGSVGSLTTNNDKTGYALSALSIQAIWDALTAALTTAGSIGKKLADWVVGTAQTGDSFARLGAPVGASISADVAAVKAVLPTALVAGRMASDAVAISGSTTAADNVEANIANLDTTISSRSNFDYTTNKVLIANGEVRIQKNVALNNFPFVMRDSVTHVPKTGVAVTARRSIDGAGFALCVNPVVEVSNGMYKINLDASDLNGDNVQFRFTGLNSDDLQITVLTQK